MQLKGSNLYDIKFHNLRQVILEEIKLEHPSLDIIPNFNLLTKNISNCNLLVLDKDYQPVFHIQCIKDDIISTIKIQEKDINLVDHLKNNLLQIIKYKKKRKEF